VYGARSRFMTRKVLAQFQDVTWPTAEEGATPSPAAVAPVDVAGLLRGMWGNAEHR
jgi:hypothetical protein